MRAEAARAGMRFKHAVTALSVISYEAGQKNLYRSLATMTDVELLAALAAGNFELSLEGSTLRPATPPAAQRTEPASHRLTSLKENQASPLDQQRQASPLQQQQQASPLDQQRGGAGQEGARQEQQHGDSRAQPGFSRQNQPRGDQPPAGTPQAQLPTAQPEATANHKKTRQSRKKAFKRYWSRKFLQGE
jgi:hypothetical protein